MCSLRDVMIKLASHTQPGCINAIINGQGMHIRAINMIRQPQILLRGGSISHGIFLANQDLAQIKARARMAELGNFVRISSAGFQQCARGDGARKRINAVKFE